METCQPAKLPSSVYPLLYKVHLVPDAATNTFQGHEVVQLQINEPTSEIQLNSKNIEIQKVCIGMYVCLCEYESVFPSI